MKSHKIDFEVAVNSNFTFTILALSIGAFMTIHIHEDVFPALRGPSEALMRERPCGVEPHVTVDHLKTFGQQRGPAPGQCNHHRERPGL